MNITKNPYYSCITSKENPYLDIISFKAATSEIIKNMQVPFLFDRLMSVINSVPYIVGIPDGKKQPAVFYTEIMKDIESNPARYNYDKKELQRAYNITFEVINSISSAYKKSARVDEELFNCNLLLLNNVFLDDASNYSINKAYFVDGIVKMSKNLAQFKK